MGQIVLVDKNTVNEAMLAINALRQVTGDDEFDRAYSALEKALEDGTDE